MSEGPTAPSAIVTGGSRGIGRGIALLLARRGWGVTIAARGVEALDDCVGELMSLGARAVSVAGDVSDDRHVTDILERHLDHFGGLDALVLAAGVGSAGPLAGYPARRLDRQHSAVEDIFSSLLLTLPAAKRRLVAASAPAGVFTPRLAMIADIAEGLFP